MLRFRAISRTEACPTVPELVTAKEIDAAKEHVATIVSKSLGNEPAMALKKYIDPRVFSAWEK